jgi:hypothetical protein
MKYQILSIDTDIITGKSSQPVTICECGTEQHAVSIRDMLSGQDETPLREYIIKECSRREDLILYADPDQIDISWKCQSYFLDRGAHVIVCFSKEEVDTIREIYIKYGIPHMVTVVAQTGSWATLDYDLRLSEFTEDDFEMIFSFLD